MIILYTVYVFIMLVWCNSLRGTLFKAYEEEKQTNKFMTQMLTYIALAFVDIAEIVVIITVFQKIK